MSCVICQRSCVICQGALLYASSNMVSSVMSCSICHVSFVCYNMRLFYVMVMRQVSQLCVSVIFIGTSYVISPCVMCVIYHHVSCSIASCVMCRRPTAVMSLVQSSTS
jgi:hypothetical protein